MVARSAIISRTVVCFILTVAFWAISTCLPIGESIAAAPDGVRRLPVQKFDASTLSSLAEGRDMAAREKIRQQALHQRGLEERRLLGPHPASRKSRARLAARGLGPMRLAPSGDFPAVNADYTDTVKVLLVRIGFETDRSGDLTSVTTDGDFQLVPDPDVRIEPAPHDMDFYRSHILGLNEYYYNQSGGRLFVRGKVLPEDPTESYKLSDVADFGPGESGGWTLEMLENLVVRMITVADSATTADGSVSLADFDDDDSDSYVVFIHAGADWQSDVNRDSPNDIPSFFVQMGNAVALNSLDGDSGAFGSMSECSIIPETTSQDGYLGSIAGVLYHEFGHALGLPDIYDTETGLSAVGVWDLMDSGPNVVGIVGLPLVPDPDPENPDDYEAFLVSGLLPPSIGAWCKWYLGWLDAEPVSGAETHFRLPAVQIPREEYPLYAGSSIGGTPYAFDEADPQLVSGGVSPRDFFLIENRWVPLGPEDFPDVTGVGMLRDEDTGVILYLAGDDNRNTGVYDYFLPGGGLLVWHVDAAAISAGWQSNNINSSGTGLRLLEADGITDVGFYDPFAQGIFGSENDPFHSGITTYLGQEGTPSTRAWDRSWTGLELDEISAALPAMEFDAVVSPLVAPPVRELSPVSTGSGIAARRLDVASVTPFPFGGAKASDLGTVVFADVPQAGSPCYLFAFNPGGSPIVAAPSGWPTGALARFDSPLAGPPAVVSGSAGERLLIGTTDGVLRTFSPAAPAAPLPVWETAVGDTLAYAPVVGNRADDSICYLACAEPGRIVILDFDGVELSDHTFSGIDRFSAPPLAVPRTDGRVLGYVVFLDDSWVLVDLEAAIQSGGIAALRNTISIDPLDDGGPDYRGAVLPLDEAERLVVVGAGGDNQSWIVDEVGQPEGTWSESLAAAPAGEIAVADIDADGRSDAMIVTHGSLQAFSASGIALTGWPMILAERFPLPPSTVLSGAVVIYDASGDGINEVFAVTDSGHLFGFDARGEFLDRIPFLWGSEGSAGICVSAFGMTDSRVIWLAGAGDWNQVMPGLPGDNGRVVGYFPAVGVFPEPGTSEWLGPFGGPARAGAVGALSDLGPAAPAAADADRFFAYPNPAVGDLVTFRFQADYDAQARLVIYNLEGEEVAVAGLSHTGGEISEYRWPLGDLASGVYLCRLTLSGDEQSASRLLRLAVER